MRYSVVTICYNAENEIAGTMESVLCQSVCDNFEYIVVDGASKDRTIEIVKAYEPRFREKGIPFRWYSEPDKGISDAFNKGVLHAEGEIVALVNAGDRLTPCAMETYAAAYEEDVDIFYGHIRWVDQANGLDYIRKSQPVPDALPLTMSIMHPACIIRKSAYESVGLYKTEFRYAMDRELLARMLMAGRKFKCIDYVFSVMSAGGVSDTHAFDAQRKQESMSIALACGVSRLRFEWVFNRAKYRYRLIKWVKEHTNLYPVLMKLCKR